MQKLSLKHTSKIYFFWHTQCFFKVIIPCFCIAAILSSLLGGDMNFNINAHSISEIFEAIKSFLFGCLLSFLFLSLPILIFSKKFFVESLQKTYSDFSIRITQDTLTWWQYLSYTSISHVLRIFSFILVCAIGIGCYMIGKAWGGGPIFIGFLIGVSLVLWYVCRIAILQWMINGNPNLFSVKLSS